MVEERSLAASELPFEFMMNALRLVDGFEPDLYAARTGLPLHALEDRMAEAEARGLLERSAARIRPTERGRLFLNDLVQRFLDAA